MSVVVEVERNKLNIYVCLKESGFWHIALVFCPKLFPWLAMVSINGGLIVRILSLELYTLFVLVVAGVNILQEIWFLFFGTVHCYSRVPLQNIQRWVIPQPFFAIHLRKRLQKKWHFRYVWSYAWHAYKSLDRTRSFKNRTRVFGLIFWILLCWKSI